MSDYQPTPEVLNAMLKKAEEKLAVAKVDLKAGFFGEVSSCAYYGAYHAVTAVLAERGLTFSSHAQTLGAFNREFVKTGIFPSDAFRKLQRLFEDRQTADYDWNRAIDQQTAAQNLEDAEQILNACREYLKDKMES